VRVLHADGTAAAGAEVHVEAPSEGERPTPVRVLTDTEGWADLALPDAPPFAVVVDAVEAAPAVLSHEATPPAGDLVVRLGAGTVRGRLVRLDGSPVPRASLYLARWLALRRETVVMTTEIPGVRGTVATADDGTFRFDRVPEGPYRPRISGEGWEILEWGMEVRSGEAPVVLHALTAAEVAALSPRVDVRVEGAASLPIEVRLNGRVTATRADSGTVANLWLNPDGLFHGRPLAPGVWTIRAEAPGYEPAETTVRYAATGPVARPVLTLLPAR
jgi:hypothetical protein